MGNLAFEVAGPSTWNSLPANFWETKTLPAFFQKAVETVGLLNW